MAFWVDDIADQIIAANPDKDREIILRDEKTASGKVHIGSLRGVIIHGVLAEALNQKGRKATFYYEINDVDPMDGLPVYLDEEAYTPYMGMPLKDIPAPDENGRPTGEVTPENNFARHYGNEFIEVIEKLGFNEQNHTKFIWASDLYAAGNYDEWIKKACENPGRVREIYRKASGSVKRENWNPLQIVCEKCGKVGPTTVFDFDGELATYVCEKDKVTWAAGCGHEGKVAPFGGRGKIPWKVEWAIKWAGFPRPDNEIGVDVEGSGKDHNAAGGSHDVSSGICKEILKAPVPFNIPYEFFLFGGAKMSASKGLGATAKEVSETMPPELLRFLMVRSKPNKPIDFEISGDTIPRLYDNHDECARIYFDKKSETPDLGRAFHYAQLDPEKITEKYFPRFSKMAFMVQIPHLDPLEEVAKMKEAPLTNDDKTEARERAEFAKMWLNNFAGERAKFEIQQQVPELASTLTTDQKVFLKSIADLLQANPDLGGEELHGQIHELKNKSKLEPRDAFSAIYIALLGKESGPQAGWFLEALERDFVIKRFGEL
ncbi:lysine--tRNA ligase [Candidatus Peregrinibacteria bacterium]|jgi:lysyl-tRNA synthetase, class I|nr:lysine--tRNA ligase [Candidatus Peregrinibacteria bacterium]